MKRLAGGTFFVLASVVAGCSGRGETGPDYLYPTEDDFCRAVGEAECNEAVVKACYGSDDSTLAEDQVSCRTARSAGCNPLGLPFHPEAAESCIVARQEALADGVWSKLEIATVETACLPVLSKQGQDGAACTADHDCDSAAGMRCVIKFGSSAGVCGEPLLVVGGEDCADPLAVCGDDFYCDPQVSHCLKRPGADQPCSAAAPCAADYYCTNSETGTCAPKTKNGLACERDELCLGGFCVGATADTTGVCSATLPLQLTSESCDPYR